jgi:hypothetical protein
MHETAARTIQGGVKGFLDRLRERRVARFQAQLHTVTMFLCKTLIRRRQWKRRMLDAKATHIQRIVRGFHARRFIYRQISAGVRLNEMWRRYLQYKSVKGMLRRIDRPHTIVLRNVRNVPKHSLASEHLKVKVSVWWHPLVRISLPLSLSHSLDTPLTCAAAHHLSERLLLDRGVQAAPVRVRERPLRRAGRPRGAAPPTPRRRRQCSCEDEDEDRAAPQRRGSQGAAGRGRRDTSAW